MFKRKKRKLPDVQPAKLIARQIDIEGLPDMDWGAPSPVIQAGEHTLSIAYYLNEQHDDWDGTKIHLRDAVADVSRMAVFEMTGVRAFAKTANDSNHGCPYLDYEKGHYGSHDVWEMKGSTKDFPLFHSEKRQDFKHLIFAFHDTSLECFCRSYEFEIRIASGLAVFEC